MTLRDQVLQELVGSVWHTTSSKRYDAITDSGAILVEPPESDHGTRPDSQGAPFVRSLGGVSLFDLRDFDPISYGEKYPLSSWETFIPCRANWEKTVWIEIDHKGLNGRFVSACEILERWKYVSSPRRFMPLIEAACIGDVPSEVFQRIIEVDCINNHYYLKS